MAAYATLNAYDARAVYPRFSGLMQYGDGVNVNPCFATEAVNMETTGGVLQPASACEVLTPALPAPIETLAMLYRRWHTQDGEKVLLVAASGGKLYAMTPDAGAWTELEMPVGVAAYQSNSWSFVTYEINPVGSAAPVDVLLLSNARDGMVMVRGDTLGVSVVDTPKKFGVIERYAERIWGGAIEDDPDMLVYSAPYDPTNWSADPDIPEDGAGDIMQPSWDGDSFTALKSFGSQLIAFKKTRVWRILGTDPGEYTFKEQYGGGAPIAATIAVDAERIFMLGDRGVSVYDGLTVAPFEREAAQDVWRRLNRAAIDGACACLHNGKYYCAIPIDGSDVNNAVMIYDTVDGTWLERNDVSVESFLPTENALYFTSSQTPGRVWRWHEDSWQTGNPVRADARWVTPWNDLGRPDIAKGGFEVYVLCETKKQAAAITVSVETEKRRKTKKLIAYPADPGGHAREKRLHFGGSGRRFRLIIESPAGTPAWRIVGGITVVAETDPD